MTYAIIKLGGKQYRVEKGDSVLVDRLDADEGAIVRPTAVLFRSDKIIVEGPELEKVKIEALVAQHLKGDKVRVFKYRPKKRYRRRAGHRSLLTRLEIREVKGPGAAKAKDEAAKVGTKAAAKPMAKAKPSPPKAKPSRSKAKAAPAGPASRAGAAKKKQTTGKGRAKKEPSPGGAPKKKRSTKES